MAATNFIVTTYVKAKYLLADVQDVFQKCPHSSNIIYAYASNALQSPWAGASTNFWAVAWCARSGGTAPEVAFVLSCTSGYLGDYPIFIFTPLPSVYFQDDFLRPGILALTRALRANAPPERVFSVFAMDPLAYAFRSAWTAETGIGLAENAVYYHAAFMYCDKGTLKAHELLLPPSYADATFSLRLAAEADIPNAAALCHGFAETSEPFVLSCQNAAKEATRMIKEGQLWVHEIQAPGGEPELASIVAVTRVTDTVSAITKVYTHRNWRSRGCAERLTRYVCQQLLTTKEAVVLYVAHDNPAAATVYKRVGFVGFASLPDGITDSWTELGFDRSKVDLGHW